MGFIVVPSSEPSTEICKAVKLLSAKFVGLAASKLEAWRLVPLGALPREIERVVMVVVEEKDYFMNGHGGGVTRSDANLSLKSGFKYSIPNSNK